MVMNHQVRHHGVTTRTRNSAGSVDQTPSLLQAYTWNV